MFNTVCPSVTDLKTLPQLSSAAVSRNAVCPVSFYVLKETAIEENGATAGAML